MHLGRQLVVTRWLERRRAEGQKWKRNAAAVARRLLKKRPPIDRTAIRQSILQKIAAAKAEIEASNATTR